MKCSSCNQELNFPEEVLKKFISCPFCGGALPKGGSENKKSGTIEDELAKIVSNFGGLEIFAEENYSRLTKALMSIDGRYEPYKDWLLIANMKHIPQKLYAVVESPQSRKQEIVNECLNTLVSLIFDVKTCEKIISCWTSALKINVVVEKKTNIEPIMGTFQHSDCEKGAMSEVFEYKTCQIGDKIWFAENLKNPTLYFMNGSVDAANKNYGRLYRWHEAIYWVPKGWRLPTVEDFEDLTAYIKSLQYDAGTALKSKNQWHGKADQGLDLFGFCAYPMERDAKTGESQAWFWTSSKTGDANCQYYCVCLRADSNDVSLQSKAGVDCYACVRYVKDVD